MSISQILNNTFGYSQFRGQQEEIINTVISGQDALVIMPTGGGKSLCFQIPALVFDGLTVVVSPLIALMNDQVSALKSIDVKAEASHSNISSAHNSEIIKAITSGELSMLYVSPEKLLSPGFLEFLQKQKVSLFAIDEAHCVSVWGNDFRPEYVKLAILKDVFPDVPTIALTATADGSTQLDIIEQLKLKNKTPFLSSFERTNIRVSAKAGLKRAEQILYFLHRRPNQAGIIYCLSRKSTEQLANKLIDKGYKAAAYHARIDPEKRSKVQQDFQDDKIDIVCATIAFGMGIDKPNIRWVIHYNMPKNIEGYYQEIGRAGRDGEDSEALLFYSWADYLNLQKFIDDSPAEDNFVQLQRAKLERMWQCATALSCRTNIILNYFGEFRNSACQHCDICQNPPELFDGTIYTQMALSAIIRSEQKLGLNLLIDVLRGSFKQEVQAGGFDQIKTFGVGREVPNIHWRHYITQMINQGIIALDFTDYSRLKITPLSTDVLKQKTKVSLARFVPQDKKEKVKVPKIEIDVSDADKDLLHHLRDWRKNKAVKQKVPAYVILHDKALKQIASLKPKSTQKLLAVEGIGKVKLQKYGQEILDLVAKF